VPLADLPLVASDDLVAATWIATIPHFTAAMTGTRLPPDVNADGTAAAWLQTGFVTVAVVGGTPDALLPVHKPVIGVKCWAAVPGSNLPPWEAAKALGTAITRATWDRVTLNRQLIPVLEGVTYPPAVVQGAYMATHFRPLYDDAADYACVQGDLALTWVTPADLITP
jgi:hypothetical protein